MKKVTLNIPDNKYQFFMELVHNLGLDEIENVDIPEEHKSIVRERIANSKPDELISWEEGRKQLQFKSSS